MKKSNTELRVGLTALLAVLILVFGTMWAKDIRFATRHNTLTFAFHNSGGLRPGDPVMINGVRKGRVLDISLDGRDVLVKASISEDVVLFEDMQARITMQDLMGGQKLEIQPGSSDQRMSLEKVAQPLRGADVVTVSEMFSQVYSYKPKLDSLFASLQSSVSELNLILQKENLRDPLHKSLAHAASLSRSLDQLMAANKPQIEASVANLHEASSALKSLLVDNQADLNHSMQTMSTVAARLDSFSTVLSGVATALDRREGTVARLLYEDEMYIRLTRTVSGLDSLTTDLRRNLGRYLSGAELKFFSIF